MKVKMDFSGWDNLQKNFKNIPTVNVGILGSDGARSDDNTGLTNAEIGARHEFGVLSENLPRRSFLWDMILLKKNELKEDVVKGANKILAQENGIVKLMERVGIAAEKIVVKAFDTGGYGTWKPLNQNYKREKVRKGLSPNILMATTQLSKSITSEVVKKK